MTLHPHKNGPTTDVAVKEAAKRAIKLIEGRNFADEDADKAERTAWIIAAAALFDVLGFKAAVSELASELKPLVEERIAVCKLAMEAWRAPSPRNPALCVKGIPLPGTLAQGVDDDGEAILIKCEYARIADLQFSLKTGKKVHVEDISQLQEALQEALRRANNDPEVRIIEIIDRGNDYERTIE